MKVRKGGGEEIPLIQGKEQWLHLAGAAVKRYPMPKGRQPRGVTPLLRSGAAAKSARLRWCRNGGEELPRVQGQARQPGGATPRLRSGVAA